MVNVIGSELNNFVHISYSDNTIKKGVNQTILPPVKGNM